MPSFNNPTQSSPTPEIPQTAPAQIKTLEWSQVKQTTNKVTINSLLSGQIPTGTNNIGKTSNVDNNLSQVQEMRFVSVKYKIYTFVIVCILILLYGPVSDTIYASLDKREQANTIDTTINARIDSQAEYTTKTNLLKKIEENKELVITCINTQDKCDQLPEEITTNMQTIKSYIQIGNLKKEKMDINESKILKTINEFMTREDPLSLERKYNGNVTNITISEKIALENNIIQVPVSMTVTFNSTEKLINFISNIENNIFYTQTDGLNDSVLYQIEKLTYDIVNYKETQDVAITLSAYAYNE